MPGRGRLPLTDQAICGMQKIHNRPMSVGLCSLIGKKPKRVLDRYICTLVKQQSNYIFVPKSRRVMEWSSKSKCFSLFVIIGLIVVHQPVYRGPFTYDIFDNVQPVTLVAPDCIMQQLTTPGGAAVAEEQINDFQGSELDCSGEWSYVQHTPSIRIGSVSQEPKAQVRVFYRESVGPLTRGSPNKCIVLLTQALAVQTILSAG
ncbi:hypothetical protein LTR91_026218 [Friedmanniomyces endolithicus]|uniref:Uncharacterized protein n=1 Tax=Friedmanniomyces endolithicus TaxID=329885 RepID=A0AAN6GXC5_9PEZI|nr:hypothetical protein LTR94_014233 [Friedmanniomyces endolithicus]KAK0780108.1 hypothetical protein LTR59_012961 [Friedmanniomyces endolithicus]KAK0786920.1 hypothetical protein LTR38_011834 [Friedmanniomyces endolithicus]KAK0798121.1 hypothetical protein LTR75_009636 [Friedmanniomyces endolithicus]KAK0834335.1 hypothetical protein LTR03_014397 [Friedmanniomyces endolithicus]